MLESNLRDTWKRLRPVCADILEEAGVQDAAPGFEDFLWAYSIFWCEAPSRWQVISLLRSCNPATQSGISQADQ